MSTLNTTFAGLRLSSPVIVGSCSLTANIDKLKEFQAAGAGAVVLKSLFEESITREISADPSLEEHPEAHDYISAFLSEKAVSDYIELIRKAKSELSIPVIASIACCSDGKWEEFAARIEQAGADALELNVMSLCTHKNYKDGAFEKMHESITAGVCSLVKIPVIIKLGANLSNPVSLCDRLKSRGAAAVVLFNRFYSSDIDVDTLSFKPAEALTTGAELTGSLRWSGIISASVQGLDIAVSGGVKCWKGVAKSLLSGAEAVEVASSIISRGSGWISEANEALKQWQDGKGFSSRADYIARMNASDPEREERLLRSQFLKYFSEVQ